MSVLNPAHGMLTHSEIGAACSPLSGAALRRRSTLEFQEYEQEQCLQEEEQDHPNFEEKVSQDAAGHQPEEQYKD